MLQKIKFEKIRGMFPIKHISISNFKSLKNVQFPCGRINVLVGRPNVGKSNILEALSLLTLNWEHKTDRLIRDTVRYDSGLNEIFHNRDVHQHIKLLAQLKGEEIRLEVSHIGGNADAYQIIVGPSSDKKLFELRNGGSINDVSRRYMEHIQKMINNQSKLHPAVAKTPANITKWYKYMGFNREGRIEHPDAYANDFNYPLRVYRYDAQQKFDDNRFYGHLLPTSGSNLFAILNTNSELRQIVKPFFNEFDLQFMFDIVSNRYELLRLLDDEVVRFPISLMADTLKRLVFHLAAIYSNKKATILFEEPESHSFPQYIRYLAEEIVLDNSNQYFIVTHSPYFLNAILESNNQEGINIIICGFKNGATTVRTLDQQEINEALISEQDFFFNIDRFE